MKIAIWHNLPSGGGKRALYYHVRGLVQRGHTREIWCPSTADQSYLSLNGLAREHVVLLKLLVAGGNSLHEKLMRALRGVAYNIEAMNQHCRICADEINSAKFDLLYVNTSMFVAASPLGRYVKIPKMLYLHEPSRQLYEASPRWPWIRSFDRHPWWQPKNIIASLEERAKLKYFKILAEEESRNIQAYDIVLANSFFSRESILRAYGVNARVCYLGVDPFLFTDHHEQRENFVVGIGSFNPSKNIEFVIGALSLVKVNRPRLLWIGNYSVPDYIQKLKQSARSLNVDFVMKELVSDSELVDILNRSTAMVYAPRLEPFGFAPLEANACGTPVVAVAEGGVRETVIDGVNGLLVEPDEKAMAAAIERLIADREFAQRLGRNGRKLVEEKWSLTASIDRLEHQLDELTHKSRH